jgi:cobalt-zinc-cadmium efflux system outer membrane protein
MMISAPLLLLLSLGYTNNEAPTPVTVGAQLAGDQNQTTYAGPVKTLTLQEVLALAERQSPQIQAARADIAGAQAGIVTAKAYPNPTADFLGGHQYRRLPDAAPGSLQHYGFSLPLDLPNKRKARMAVASLGRASSQLALEDTQLHVRAMVKQAFYEVLRRKEQVTLADQNLQLVDDLRRRIDVKVNVGEAGRLELTRAEAELATARAALRSAHLRYVTAVSALRAAVGAPMSENITVDGQLAPRVELPGLENLQKTVMVNHPVLKQANVEVERAQAELRNQRAQRVPEPSVVGYYERQPDLGFFQLGVSIPLPLWNRRQGPIAEAQAEINHAQATRDGLRLRLTTDLESAYGEYQVADEQVRSFQTGALREAQSALTGAEAAYKAGERGIIDVLDAQRVLRSVRLEYLNAQFDREAALIDLERLRALEVKGNIP